MKTAPFWLLVACSLAPTLLRGQQLSGPAATPFYRLYAGVSASVQSYQFVVPMGGIKYLETVGIYPLQGYVGYRLTPRLAVQAGFSQRRPANDDYYNSGLTPDGQPYTTSDVRRQYDRAISILLRYRLTRHAARKCYFDALLGFTQQQHQYFREVITTRNGQVVAYDLENSRSNNSFLSLGLTANYAVGRHLSLGVDVVGNANSNLLRYVFQQNSFIRVTPSVGAGLRYYLLAAAPTQPGQ